MKNLKCFTYVLSTIFVLACFSASVSGQENKLASISAAGSSVKWDVAAPFTSLTLTIAAPDGRVFSKEFSAGSSPQFSISSKLALPDGVYTYELRLSPVLSAAAKEALKATRGNDDDPESVRATRSRPVLQPMVESGSFAILNGMIMVAGAQEPGARVASQIIAPPRSFTSRYAMPAGRQHHALLASPDQVIPDDLIVQGSACVGLDCVNNESFGFDSIRVKENNDRIQFDDTSTSAGFATNNWQIRANSSANGGASFLGIVDQGATGNSETGTIVFEVDAGAAANALRVASNSKLGLRTATPVLDVHVNTTDTPAMRFEQNNSGGFTAQTWDVAGNEANFFVRDVTGGSRLPLRIRPGAPTSSVDVSATGAVGIGDASPGKALDVVRTGSDSASNQAAVRVRTTSTTTGFGPALYLDSTSMTSGRVWSLFPSGSNDLVGTTGSFNIFDGTASAARLTITPAGNVGIGTTAPSDLLSVNGNASKPGGGSWSNFSDLRLKTIKGRFTTGLQAVMQLQPLRYEYKRDNALGLKSFGEHVGFGAQQVQKVIPEAVTANDQGYLLVNNDPIIWTMLNAIKEQQKEIEQLKAEVSRLRASHRRHR
jgi:hypothetical protein